MTSAEPWVPLLRQLADLDTDRLEGYALELERWNRTVRLVGPETVQGIRLQIADALLPFLLRPPRFPVLDIGSGAGLPGIPIAVAFPGELVVCLESRAKRVSFLRHAARLLSLSNLSVVHARAEDAPREHPHLCGAFRVATARAVADIGTLLTLSRPFLAPGGEVLLPRGPGPEPSVSGWTLSLSASYAPPEGLGARRLLVYSPLPP